jgi:hypothetical protein
MVVSLTPTCEQLRILRNRDREAQYTHRTNPTGMDGTTDKFRHNGVLAAPGVWTSPHPTQSSERNPTPIEAGP